jgi:hypothetical protein
MDASSGGSAGEHGDDTTGRGMEDHPHLRPFMLLPAAVGTCSECAVEHAPEQPHNQQSLFYQYRFYGDHGRWPTWADAMAHCPAEVRRRWTEALTARGVKVGTTEGAPECQTAGDPENQPEAIG